MFQHENFRGQLIWALQCYVSVDIQGPDESFFEEEMQEPSTVPKGFLLSFKTCLIMVGGGGEQP